MSNSGKIEISLRNVSDLSHCGHDDEQPNVSVDESCLECPICFEAIPERQLLQTRPCHHQICSDCFQEYCHYHISLHQLPIPCFVAECDQSLTDDFVLSKKHSSARDGEVSLDTNEQSPPNETIISSHHEHKYRNLMRKRCDPSLVACTRCSELVPATSNGNDRTCPFCRHQFCAVHGDAHLRQSCTEYMQSTAKSATTPQPSSRVRRDQRRKSSSPEQSTASTAPASPASTAPESGNDSATNASENWKEAIKPCSHCGALLHKYSGCNHVVCPACHKDMCFACGNHYSLQGTGVTKFCTACQQGYLDHRYLWQIRLYYAVTLPLVLPFLLLYSVLVAVGVLMTGCCGGCFGCGAYLESATAIEDGGAIVEGTHATPDIEGQNAAAGSNGRSRETEAQPQLFFRAATYITCITFFPLVLMSYDMGWRHPMADDFIEWCRGTRSARQEEETPDPDQEHEMYKAVIASIETSDHPST